MFLDFNKTFNNKKQTETKLSPTLIQHISQSLPSGLKYKEVENGICIIDSEIGTLSIKGLQINPTKEQLEIIGKPITVQKLFEYAYNSQERIPLKLIGNKIIVNNEEIDSKKFIWTPDNSVDISSENGEWFAMPPKMNHEFILNIGGNNENMDLKIHRIPNKSLNIYKFESLCNDVIELKYEVNIETHQMTLTMNICLNKSKLLIDSIKAIKIYNAFVNGCGKIAGNNVPTKLNSINGEFNKELLILLNKLVKIEEILDIKFNANFDKIDMDTYSSVEKLYQNLINLMPIRDNSKLNTISGEWKFDKEKNEIKSNIGKSMFFKFDGSEKFNILGTRFELPCLICIFNSKLDDILEKKNNYKIKLVDEDKYKPMYMSILCLKSEKDLASYPIMEKLDIFKNAKTTAEYLNLIHKNN